jgi:CTP:molybdopterin cytidylyltransferase MocA
VRLAVLVLAAGASRRFGPEDKLLAPLAGQPLAAHAARTARAVPALVRLVAVHGMATARLFPGFEPVLVAPRGRGAMSASLAAGVARARERGASHVLVLLADMPRVPGPLARRVVQRAASGAVGAAAVRPDARGRAGARMPPACFSARWFNALEAQRGDRGAGALLARLPAGHVLPTAPALLADVDRPADLVALARRD